MNLTQREANSKLAYYYWVILSLTFCSKLFLSCFNVLNLLSFFSANFVVLFCEAAYLGYAEFSKKNESTASN